MSLGLWAAMGALVLPIGGLLAAWVLSNAPAHRMNRRLAWLLFVDGLVIGVAGGLTYMADSWAGARAFRMAAAVPVIMMPIAYVRFLALLDSPLSRLLRSRVLLYTLWVTAVAVALAVLRGWGFWIEAEAADFGAHAPSWKGPVAALAFFSVVIGSLLGLVVAVTSMQRAPRGSIRRTQAKIFAYAFGLRDAIFGAVMTLWVIEGLTGIELLRISDWGIPATNAAPLVTMVLLTYGILRYQMLDIDLKIKLGISRTTVAAIIAAAAILGGEALERAFDADQLWAAFAVGAVTALAFRPLARLGDRFADKAMSGVEDTPTYRSRRARAIYQAAVEDANRDGKITPTERAVLDGLARNLGLSASETSTLEGR